MFLIKFSSASLKDELVVLFVIKVIQKFLNILHVVIN